MAAASSVLVVLVHLPRMIARSKGVCGSMVSRYTDMVRAERHRLPRTLSAKDSSALPGNAAHQIHRYVLEALLGRAHRRPAASASWARPGCAAPHRRRTAPRWRAGSHRAPKYPAPLGAVRLSGVSFHGTRPRARDASTSTAHKGHRKPPHADIARRSPPKYTSRWLDFPPREAPADIHHERFHVLVNGRRVPLHRRCGEIAVPAPPHAERNMQVECLIGIVSHEAPLFSD